MDLLTSVRQSSVRVRTLRQETERAERSLYANLRKYLVSTNASDIAKRLEVTPAYLSDIKHARRTFSDAVLKGLGGL